MPVADYFGDHYCDKGSSSPPKKRKVVLEDHDKPAVHNKPAAAHEYDGSAYDPGDAEDEEYSDDEKDDEHSSQKPTSKEFFTDANPKTPRHKWLVKSYEYLTRPTAGDQKPAIRLQHVTQMRNLLEAVDPDGDNILGLLEDSGDAVWSMWVKPQLDSKTKKRGTIISYLTYMRSSSISPHTPDSTAVLHLFIPTTSLSFKQWRMTWRAGGQQWTNSPTLVTL